MSHSSDVFALSKADQEAADLCCRSLAWAWTPPGDSDEPNRSEERKRGDAEESALWMSWDIDPERDALDGD